MYAPFSRYAALTMPLLMLPLWSVLLILGGILFFSGRRDDTPP